MWKEPIIDRTQTDIDYAKASAQNRDTAEPLKGTQNYTDWERLTENIHYLAEVFSEYGYNVQPMCRDTWSEYDMPYESDLVFIRHDVDALRNAFCVFSDTPVTPALPYNHYTKINNLERIMLDIYTLLENMPAEFAYTGEIYTGESDF